MVEDQNNIGIRSDLIFEAQSQEAIIVYLVELLRQNANIINDFKFKIGIYSDFDMLVDPWVLVKDIRTVISSFDSHLAHKSKEYVNFYLELIDHIVDVEESTKDFNAIERQNYCKTLIEDFRNIAFDAYLGGSDIKFLGSYDTDLLNQLYIKGIFLPYLSNKLEMMEFNLNLKRD